MACEGPRATVDDACAHHCRSGSPDPAPFGFWRARTIENGVSISFRWGGVFDCPRHGGGQAPALRWNRAVSIPFPRAGVSVPLPVGKDRQILTVSIPFKREGVSELMMPTGPFGPVGVSIPFKRDGVSEHEVAIDAQMGDEDAKVSIPFKRDSVSELNSIAMEITGGRVTFLFPSNEKAFLKSSRI